MQYNRSADGTMSAAAQDQHRHRCRASSALVPILNGIDSVFATDALRGLLDAAQSLTGKTYGADEADDVALRLIADHGRAMTMLVADGVLPSNEGRATCCAASSAARCSPPSGGRERGDHARRWSTPRSSRWATPTRRSSTTAT